jgi:deoxyribonuclease-4
MLLGAHMSIAGGLHKALERGKSVGCDIIQIFVKSSNQWKAKPLSDDEVRLFSDAKKATGISIVVGHTSYLINVASPDPLTYRKSLDSLRLELERSEALGLPALVLHPGAHMGEGEQAGLKKIAASLDKVHADLPGLRARIALEVTAGQGTTLGFRFEHLAQVIASVKKELASRIDRHEHIGKGRIGLEGFRWLLNDKRLTRVPMSLETHKGKDLREDVENLATLRNLIKHR